MTAAPGVDDPVAARQAGADWLSLALIDARNRTLRWLEALEASPAGPDAPAGGWPSALWLAGHAGWWSEHWILRHLQAARGERADADGPRLAMPDPRADAFHARWRRSATLGASGWHDPAAVRAWLADRFEAVLALLATPSAGGDEAGADDALYFFRQALRVEDRTGESLAALAQAHAVDGPWPAPPALRAERPPLSLPARRHRLGGEPGPGLTPGPERWAHPVELPEGEIDAQPVSWARWSEFVADGGYDTSAWWSEAGWDWVRRVGRRAPRFVEQMGGGAVVASHDGRLQRLAPGRSATHVTRHEAEAWCRWAGRRLPTEPEWEHVAGAGGGLGFVWGEVLEWVAGAARGYPGHTEPIGEPDPLPPATAGAGVLRGASRWTAARAAHPRARRFARPDDDRLPTGFRTCAL